MEQQWFKRIAKSCKLATTREYKCNNVCQIWNLWKKDIDITEPTTYNNQYEHDSPNIAKQLASQQ